ncbi:hypothetical protein [Mucilaginibacter gotjawali]|uniref:Uncharacterized protein n=2 Tax=Mucilaginibacter gotjawali TaxID=1550579 RepID=A0A0X8X5V0_9SPHI|nr:hypothetical protein [Mucilaginibacter gotjawali]MBB3055217.1 hypothetical protein [Mucilaginibacter gotjawali]BAU56164.1 hypothetical protein MgSA37_04361 [Mucilaginibacter gotjawali]
MKIKETYNYLFCKIYSFWETVSIPEFLSEVKAIISIIALQEVTLASLVMYYLTFIGNRSHLGNTKGVTLIISLLLASFNYFYFIHYDQWKLMVKEFRGLPKQKKDKWDKAIGILIVAIVVNFILAWFFYLR